MKNVKSLPIAGVALLLAAYFAGPPARFWPAYLVSWLFVATVAMGALFFVLIHHLTRAGWSVVVRRQAESIASAFPVLALLFLPMALRLENVYPWSGGMAGHKAIYLNVDFFRLRAFVYFSLWSLIAWWFRRLSIRQDMTGSLELTRSMRRASAPALVVFGFTLTFAAFDWVMSLEPHWFSSIFGVYFFAGSVVAYFAVQSMVSAMLHYRGLVSATAEHFHGLGKLLFGFLCFWAYIAFSQYLLIWYANLPDETVWYAHRLQKSWGGATLALALGHFVLPFFFFLSVKTKRTPSLLVAGSAFVLAMHYLDLYWIVIPSTAASASLHWVDLVTLAGTTAVLAGVAGLLMDRASLVPHRDPQIDESLSFDNG